MSVGLSLTEEQQELAAVVRQLLDKHAGPQQVRDAVDPRAGAEDGPGWDPALWALLCEQVGVAALAVPEEHDGYGAGLVEAVVVLEELGRTLAPVPALASLVLVEALLGRGDAPDPVVGALLGRLAAGEVGTLVWAGPATAPPAAGAGRPAEPVRWDGARLTGTVAPVLDAGHAEVLVVAAEGADGPVLVLVDPAAEGVTTTPTTAVDLTLSLATVALDGAPGQVLGGDASAALARARRSGTVAVAALQVGCAQRALDMLVRHTQDRHQFGRALASFQALKHRMADVLVRVEVMRSTTWQAATAAAADGPQADEAVAVAASVCGDGLALAASECVQLHGGIAITWEHDAQLVFKRAHALGQLFGTAHQHRAALAL